MQRTRSMPMDATTLQNAPSHTPIRRNTPEPMGATKTAETNYQASKSSQDDSHQKPSAVSSSPARNEKYTRATVQDNHGADVTASTPSFKPRAPKASRALSHDWKSSQRPRDGAEYVQSFDDVLASHHPRRQETFPRLPPSGRMNRMNSENVLGNGRPSQFGQFLTPGAVEGQESRPRFQSTLQGLLSNHRYAVGRCPISPWLLISIVHRFRILVVGKVLVIYQTYPVRN